MKTPIILVAIAGALLCVQMPAADNGTGKIVVYSEAYLGPATKIALVTPEGQQVIALPAKRYYEFVVSPGSHTLIRHGGFGKDAIEVRVKNGETVYVENHVIPFVGWVFDVRKTKPTRSCALAS
jgi:hypothetical protein